MARGDDQIVVLDLAVELLDVPAIVAREAGAPVAVALGLVVGEDAPAGRLLRGDLLVQLDPGGQRLGVLEQVQPHRVVAGERLVLVGRGEGLARAGEVVELAALLRPLDLPVDPALEVDHGDAPARGRLVGGLRLGVGRLGFARIAHAFTITLHHCFVNSSTNRTPLTTARHSIGGRTVTAPAPGRSSDPSDRRTSEVWSA